MSKKDVSQSKFLSLVLRHQPETIGVLLDPNGWIDVEVLLAAMARHGKKLPANRHQAVFPVAVPLIASCHKRFETTTDGR